MSADDQIRNILIRLERLEKKIQGSQGSNAPDDRKKVKTDSSPTKIDFSLNERNFITTYARGLSGSKKFTLLLAFMVKGKVGENAGASSIASRWNKMKAKNLMGYAFNTKYPTEAKTRGWVDSKKYGTYCLRNSWTDIFS